MALSLDKLLQENKNRYEMCTAAIRVAQTLAEMKEEDWKNRSDDKISIVAMENVLHGRSIIHRPDPEEYRRQN